MMRQHIQSAKIKRRFHGFALIELTVAIVVMAVVSVATFVGGSNAINEARVSSATNDFSGFDVALTNYMYENSTLTTDNKALDFDAIAEDISDYLPEGMTLDTSATIPLTGSIRNSNYELVAYQTNKNDPWGNPYYILMDQDDRNAGHTEYFITVVSAGTNSKADMGGTLDDDDMFLLMHYQDGTVTGHIYNMAEDTEDATGTKLEAGKTGLSQGASDGAAPRNEGISVSSTPDAGAPAPEAGHTHRYVVVKTSAANCTAAGTRTLKCSCGDTKTETIPGGTHPFGKWTVAKAATCDEAGSMKRTCSACSATETKPIAAKGHSYSKAATGEASSDNLYIYDKYVCKTCGTVEERNKKTNITVQLKDAAITVGFPEPTYEYTLLDGAGKPMTGVTAADIGLTIDCDVENTRLAGTYNITATASSDNHNISIKKGTLTITYVRQGNSVHFSDRIGVYDRIRISDIYGSDYYATKTYIDGDKAGKTIQFPYAEWRKLSNTQYAANYLNNKSYIKLYEASDEYSRNVYFEDGTRASDAAEMAKVSAKIVLTDWVKNLGEGYDSMKRVAIATLDICAEVQKLCNYKTDNLANSEITQTHRDKFAGDVNEYIDSHVEGTNYVDSVIDFSTGDYKFGFIFKEGEFLAQKAVLTWTRSTSGKEFQKTILASDFERLPGGKYQITVSDADYGFKEARYEVTCSVYDSNENIVGYVIDSPESYIARQDAPTDIQNCLMALCDALLIQFPNT